LAAFCLSLRGVYDEAIWNPFLTPFDGKRCSQNHRIRHSIVSLSHSFEFENIRRKRPLGWYPSGMYIFEGSIVQRSLFNPTFGVGTGTQDVKKPRLPANDAGPGPMVLEGVYRLGAGRQNELRHPRSSAGFQNLRF
jgi:hypothetical protein